MRLRDKVTVITGAKSGIGFATAQRFAAEGAKVVVADVRDARAEVEELKQHGSQVLYVQADVSQETDVTDLFRTTVAAYGRLDVLVNNAGVCVRKKVTDTSEAEWDRLIDVNLKGAFLCSKAAISLMERSGGGAIVNVSSGLGLVGGTEAAAYCASKGGVVQLTRALAVDHGPAGIRVNCVCPGPISTPMLETIIQSSPDPETKRKAIDAGTLLKRVGLPGEIANVILFLASEEASYMTGAIVAVDGGATAQ